MYNVLIFFKNLKIVCDFYLELIAQLKEQNIVNPFCFGQFLFSPGGTKHISLVVI